MPRHKVLKSVARSVADSFTSLMNYSGDDYIMGHLLNAARVSGHNELRVNLLTGESSPHELLTPPVARSVKRCCDDFPDLVSRSQSDPTFVHQAELCVVFDTKVARQVRHAPSLTESPYVCEVTLVDDRGKTYLAKLEGWWYPE